MKREHTKEGFTLLEILIAVAIIGLLAGLGIPSYLRATRQTRSKIFLNELRIANSAFSQFMFDNSTYPEEKNPAEMPTGMSDYLSNFEWSGKTAIGGYWDWDYDQYGVTAAISVYQPTISSEEMAKIDASIDDGILDSGRFRARSGGYMYVIEEHKE
ncbi:type II secretion system protein [Pontiellaceae bacterium B1224]|nr:type II secretion system protein [Pontiellaceae bacterium B1224]